MLTTHMGLCEKLLASQSAILNSAGHNVHKGTAREIFIRDFLSKHLPESVGIAVCCEIIDLNTKPGAKARDYDIVIYKKNYPKIHFGGAVNALLSESVIATIEVKTTLDQAGLEQAICAANAAKKLSRNIDWVASAGYVPKGIFSFVVAYDGPAQMQTVQGWIGGLQTKNKIVVPPIPKDETRLEVVVPTIDAVFVLGKGFILCDNAPVSPLTDQERKKHAGNNNMWVYNDSPLDEGSLLLLFMYLTTAISGLSLETFNPAAYAQSFSFPNVTYT